jgi:hypothetical protein
LADSLILDEWSQPCPNCEAHQVSGSMPIRSRFEFWKAVKSQIADPAKPINREQFPNETAYLASEWRGHADECWILLEKHH